MAIALVQGKTLTKTNAAADDQTITLDSAPTEGNILILTGAVDDAYATITPDAADGWTSIAAIDGPGAGGFPGLRAWWRRAGAGDDATYSVNVAQDAVFTISEWSGCVASGSPIDVSATNSGSDSSLEAPDITTTQVNTMGIAVYCIDLGSTTLSTPTGMTADASLFGQDGEDITSRVTYEEYASAGATGQKTSTAGASALWAALQFALAPFVAVTYEQEGFRWRNDDGSESAATWAATQDTDITAPSGDARRLRMLTNVSGDAPSEGLKLQYRKAGTSEWKDILRQGL